MPRLLQGLTIERSAAVIVFILLFAMAARVSVDTDMWWHLRVGEQIFDTGEMIYADSFSYTFAGAVHRNHSAGAQLLMRAVWELGGHAGMSLFTAILAVVGMYFLHRAGQGSIYVRAFVLIAGAAGAALFWSPRPQMFTFLFASVLVFLLRDFKRSQRSRLWWIIPLMWLWANAHGGFAIGYVFLAAFIAGELLNRAFGLGDFPLAGIRQLVWVSVISAMLLVINPNGVGIYALPFETLGLQALRRFIQEWQPPDFNQPFTWGWIALLLMTVAAVWASRLKFDWTDWLLVGGALAMALTAGRNLPFFVIAAVPVVTCHFDSVLRANGWTLQPKARESPGRVCLNLLLVSLVMLGALAKVSAVADSDAIYDELSEVLPVDAVNYLNGAALEGNMFNSYNWGGYLMFYARQHRVYIDGRTDLYAGFLNDYFGAAVGSDEWRGEFKEWDIRFALIETDSGLAQELSADDGWRTAYQDALASIFVRAD